MDKLQQAPKVTNCRDCSYYRLQLCCNQRCFNHGMATPKDFTCCYGERREGENQMNELTQILRGMADMLDGPQNAGNLVVPAIIGRFYEAADAIERLEAENATLRKQQEQPNEPLTYEQLQQMEGEPVWCKKEMAYVFVSTLIDKPYKEIYYFTNRGMCKTALLHHTEFYRRKPEQEG